MENNDVQWRNTGSPQLPEPTQQPAPSNDLQAAKDSEQAFMQEISQQPKAALTGGVEPAPEASATPEPTKPSSIFGNDLLSKLTGRTEAKKEEPQEQPYQPFEDTEEAAPEAARPAPSGGGGYELKKSKSVVGMFDMGISRMLAFYDRSADYKSYKLDDDEKQEIAEALADWNPEVLQNMPGYTRFLMAMATIYGPKFMSANERRKINTRNIIALQSPVQQPVHTMQQAVGNVVQFTPAPSSGTVVAPAPRKVVQLGSERTRYQIHNGGKYQYSRSSAGSKPQFVKVDDPDGELVDLQDINALKHIILASGGWRPALKKLTPMGVTEQWMTERGLNTNNPEIDDDGN